MILVGPRMPGRDGSWPWRQLRKFSSGRGRAHDLNPRRGGSEGAGRARLLRCRSRALPTLGRPGQRGSGEPWGIPRGNVFLLIESVPEENKPASASASAAATLAQCRTLGRREARLGAEGDACGPSPLIHCLVFVLLWFCVSRRWTLCS